MTKGEVGKTLAGLTVMVGAAKAGLPELLVVLTMGVVGAVYALHKQKRQK